MWRRERVRTVVTSVYRVHVGHRRTGRCVRGPHALHSARPGRLRPATLQRGTMQAHYNRVSMLLVTAMLLCTALFAGADTGTVGVFDDSDTHGSLKF